MTRVQRFLVVLLIALVAPTLTLAAPSPEGSGSAAVERVLVSELPASSEALFIVTDGADAQDCTVGGGGTRVLCHWNGSAWAPIGDGNEAGAGGAPQGGSYVTMTADGTLTNERVLGTSVIMYGALGSRPSPSATNVGRLYCVSDSGDQRCSRDNGTSWDDLSLDWTYVLNVIVTESQLGTGAVTATKIADGAVTSGKLADGAVTSGKLGANSVGSSTIIDGSVTADDIDAAFKAAGGDLTGTYPNPTINTDSVALGTDTTGDYLGGTTANQGLTRTGGAEGGTVGLQSCPNDGDVLQFDAGGTWECAAISSGGGGGTPGGATTQVQFNDAGAFAGDSGLTYNKTTDALTVAGGVVGNASTATALAADGTNSSSGQAIRGVDAQGNAQDAFDVATQAEYDALPTNLAPGGSVDISATYATRAYADAIASNLDPKFHVILVPTGNVTLSGEQTIQGVLTSTSRVGLVNQTNKAQNGIWVTAAGAWSRATDADQDAEVNPGMFFHVSSGTIPDSGGNKGTQWVLQTAEPITVGTTDLEFALFGQQNTVEAGAGLTLTGDTIDAVATPGGCVTVNANDLGVTSGCLDNTHLSGSAAITKGQISNTGTFESSEIPSLASRMTPDGSDPLATASATGLADANAEGTANSFARSDHTHKRDVRVKQSGSTVGTRGAVNLVPGNNISISSGDDAANDEIDITITAADQSAPPTVAADDSCVDEYPNAVLGTTCVETQLDDALQPYNIVYHCTYPENEGSAAACDGFTDWSRVGGPLSGEQRNVYLDLTPATPMIFAETDTSGAHFRMFGQGGGMKFQCLLEDGTQCNYSITLEEGRRFAIVGVVDSTVLEHLKLDYDGLIQLPFFDTEPDPDACNEDTVGYGPYRFLSTSATYYDCVETEPDVYAWVAQGSAGTTIQSAYEADADGRVLLEVGKPFGFCTESGIVCLDALDDGSGNITFQGVNTVTDEPVAPTFDAESGKMRPFAGDTLPTLDCDSDPEKGFLGVDTNDTTGNPVSYCSGATGWRKIGVPITKSINIPNPTTSDTNKVQLIWPGGVTLERVWCSTDTGTATIQFDERAEATPNSAGTDSLTSTLVCDNNSQATTSFSDATIAADVPHNLQITATASSPTVVRIHLRARMN